MTIYFINSVYNIVYFFFKNMEKKEMTNDTENKTEIKNYFTEILKRCEYANHVNVHD